MWCNKGMNPFEYYLQWSRFRYNFLGFHIAVASIDKGEEICVVFLTNFIPVHFASPKTEAERCDCISNINKWMKFKKEEMGIVIFYQLLTAWYLTYKISVGHFVMLNLVVSALFLSMLTLATFIRCLSLKRHQNYEPIA